MSITRNFKALMAKLNKGVAQGIDEWQENILKPRSQEYVPEKTGELANSYKAEREANVGNTIRYTIKYGDNLSGENGENYAAEVHEMPDSYNYTKPGSGPRYLERALQETQGLLIPTIIKKNKF
jgi:hypothetical protein